MERGSDAARGVYETARAAALAGVPKTTLHFWARTELLTPSISAHPRLWSWLDLLTIRAVDWLRSDQPRVSVQQLRKALGEMYAHGFVQDEVPQSVRLSHGGTLFFKWRGTTYLPGTALQVADDRVLDLVAPYSSGPDLLEPRQRLRIIPGKLGGEPHVEGTRIPSTVLFALSDGGYEEQQILEMYPDVSEAALADAIALERSLAA